MKPFDLLTRMHLVDNAEWHHLSWPLRYLLMIRAPLLIMTISSSLIGILYAAREGFVEGDRAIALLLGLSLAHALNNLLNDWTDSKLGIDADNYFRMQYGVQPIEQSLVSQFQFALVVLLTMIFALSAAFYLYLQSGIDVFYLTLIGGFFVLFYTWPLKHFALGEVAVFLCWGPLMILGSYTVVSGQSAFLGADMDVFLLSIVYGLAPTLVIMGKHMDKYEIDKRKGVKSLPVVIGIKTSAYICILIIAIQ